MSKLYDTTCVRFETVEDRGWVSTQYFRTSGPYGVVERPEAEVGRDPPRGPEARQDPR